jgi:hypothetical protein
MIVILSEVTASQSEAVAESNYPYSSPCSRRCEGIPPRSGSVFRPRIPRIPLRIRYSSSEQKYAYPEIQIFQRRHKHRRH